LTAIPKALHEHINTAYPAHVCLVGTTLSNGFAQITPRGSTMVYDDDQFALWEGGRRCTPRSISSAASKRTRHTRQTHFRQRNVRRCEGRDDGHRCSIGMAE